MDIDEFKQRIKIPYEEIECLINELPYKGDKYSDSQKICLQQALMELDQCVNGLEESDFIEDEI